MEVESCGRGSCLLAGEGEQGVPLGVEVLQDVQGGLKVGQQLWIQRPWGWPGERLCPPHRGHRHAQRRLRH